MKLSLNNLLVIDIETVRSHPVYDDMPERLRQQWDKKAAYLRNEDELTPAELYEERAGIYAEFGKVITIAAGFFSPSGQETTLRVKAFYDHDEAALLQAFNQLLAKFDERALTLCAHNGKEFDFPYLCRRMLVNGIALPPVLDTGGKKPWEVNHLDTMELWKFGDRKNFTSLELLATLFDIPTSKEGIDGSMVSQVYYDEDDLERIARYCSRDVVVTAQLLLRLHQMPLIKDENIIVIEN